MNITEHEMRGLLTGKCLPGDMRLNEELPVYLVRKFTELKESRDSHMQAEMTWEKSMMAAIGEDGVGCVVKAIAALKEERDALAAAHYELRESMAAIHNTIRLDGVNTSLGALLSASKRAHEASVPTDAHLNSVRAEGVDKAIAHLHQKSEGTGHIGVPVMVLESLTAQLRAGKDGEV